jgi:hypothetical protein
MAETRKAEPASEPAAAPAEAPAAETKKLPGAGTEDGARLERAHAAFEAGDYHEVRALTQALFESRDGDVARAARELHARTSIDPVQVGVIAACLVLFAVIVYVYVLR